VVEFEFDQVTLNQECVNFELVYLIVVVFDMKSEFQLVGDHFKSIYGGLVVNLD